LKLRLIYNPAGGRGRTRRHVAEAVRELQALGASVDVHASANAADLTRAAADGSRGGYDRVVVCGGDGSVHYAVRDFDLGRGTLALIPLGSGDDFARVTGVPRTLRAACANVVHGTVRPFDVALANGIRYMGVAGLGFDSDVNRFANQNVRLLRGSAVYVYAILRILPRFTPRPVRIRMNDCTRDEQIMFATVGNTRQYGGGIRIVPAADPADGILDYCIVHRTSRFQLVVTLPLAYSGAHVRKPFVETGRGNSFLFESDRPLDVYADGEFVTQTPVSFELEKQKLRLVVPPAVTR
jgi:YegS/Rv2252/BmrU family lipid kinase